MTGYINATPTVQQRGIECRFECGEARKAVEAEALRRLLERLGTREFYCPPCVNLPGARVSVLHNGRIRRTEIDELAFIEQPDGRVVTIPTGAMIVRFDALFDA